MLSIATPQLSVAETTQDVINKVVTLSEQREALQTEVDSFNAQINFLQSQIDRTNQEIKLNEEKISIIKKELDIEQGYLSEYLRVIYEDEQMSLFEKVMKANTFSDFVDKTEYLNNIKDEFKSTVSKISKAKRKLDREQKLLGELAIQNQLAQASIAKQREDKEKVLKSVTEEERKLREKFSLRLSKFRGMPFCKSDGKLIKSKYSVFSFPTNCGFVTQGFGMTEYASVDNAYRGAIHNGMDVGVNTGTPILSVGPGTVYAKGASPSGGWGNWVMIKQDKVKIEKSEIEFYSLYGHMVAESHLKVGQRVQMGDVVGFVGGTPHWPVHLHYSLYLTGAGWAEGKPGPFPGNVVDPFEYMDITISTQGTDWDPKYAH